jgi:hypothetical protein
VPLAGGGLARFTDRDVILVRAGRPAPVRAANPRAALYAARIPLPNPLLGGASIVRGWTSVDVTARGRSFRFVDTHLEAFDAGVRNLQAQELAAVLAGSRLPVVLVGDLNSRPDDTTGAYGILTGALHLTDAWVAVHGPEGASRPGRPTTSTCPSRGWTTGSTTCSTSRPACGPSPRRCSANSSATGPARCRARHSGSGRPTTPVSPPACASAANERWPPGQR